jgi:hypothetical protein
MNGKLCFVITQSLFQSVGGGEGFRRFTLGKKGVPFGVLQVDDMVDLQPFDSAVNRTSVFLCKKGEATVFPVEYHLWKKSVRGAISIDLTLKEVQERIKIKYLKAQSVDNTSQGAWIIAKPNTFKAIKNVSGKSYYKARMGAHTGGANGLYWVDIKEQVKDNYKIANYYNIGKIKYLPVEAIVEPDFLYPLLRGRETKKWGFAPSLYIILAQDHLTGNKAYTEKHLSEKYPLTFEYFNSFKKELLNRTHYKKHFEAQEAPFYSTYNVGSYTFAKYKVAWKYISQRLDCCVLGEYEDKNLGRKVVIPDTKLVIISFDEEDEAHYVCALLNSSPSMFIVKAYVVETQIAPHILNNIAIPKYEESNIIHKDLVHLSKLCHEKVASGIEVIDLEKQIDELSARLWKLSEEELRDIKESLNEL